MPSLKHSISANAIVLQIIWNHFLQAKPLIRRSIIYDFLPQYPTWFTNLGHTSAKIRFLHKRRNRYSLETLAACPYCQSKHFIPLARQERSGLQTSVALCLDCALVFTNPRLDSAALLDHYQKDYRDIERGERSDLHQFMFNLQGSKGPTLWEFMNQAAVEFAANASMLDIGCGEGGLLHWFSKNAPLTKFIGVELNTAAAAYGRSLGLEVRETTFSNSNETYDLIVIEQVLEHLAAPDDLLGMIARSQKVGAWLYIGVPGILNFPKGYDHNFIAYLQYGHMVHYCLHTLERLVVPYGYQLVRGDEIVRGLFRRTDEKPSVVSTPPIRADAVIDLLQSSERVFLQRGSHLRNNGPEYRAYSKLLFQSWLHSFSSDAQ